MGRAGAAVLGLCGALLSASTPAAHAVETPPSPARALLVAGLPAAEARRAVEDRPAALGLGAYPESRDPGRFLREVSVGAPLGREGAASPLGGRPGNLARALAAGGLSIGIASGGPERIAGPLGAAFSLDPSRVSHVDRAFGGGANVVVIALASAGELDQLVANLTPGGDLTAPPIVLLGVGERTPLLVAVIDTAGDRLGGSGGAGILTGGISRRPAVVTPYDLAATILSLAGAYDLSDPPEGFIGGVLHVERALRPLDRVDALAARLERDDSYGPMLVAATVIVGLGGLALAWLLALAGRRGAAIRFAQGASLATVGLLGAWFVPSGRAEVRALAVVAAFVVGAAIPPRDPLRAVGRWMLAAAAALAVLTVVASLRPGGEPGLSLWGNPLVSWRFFGLQNAQAAFIAGGVIVGAVLAGVPVRLLVPLAATGAVVIGAPALGANFVGVLTFAFGATLALLALARRRFRLRHLLAAGGVALVAFGLALLADTGSPASHGGQAVERVARGGLDAAFDFVRIRVRLNLDLIRDFPGGVALAPAYVVALLALARWGRRAGPGPPGPRAGILGAAAAALAALVFEDSGFYTAADLGFYPLAAWTLLNVRPPGARGGAGG